MKTANWILKAAMAAAAVTLAAAVPAMAQSAIQTALSAPADNRPITYTGSLPFGAYDPPGDFTNDKFARIEHLFLPWEDVDLTFLSSADEYALARGREILITIEPWTWSQDKRIFPKELYTNITTGLFDGTIAEICGTASHYKSKTTIRWAQEMEETNGRFAWSGWKPDAYKDAYRRFVSECRAAAPNVKFMWSPKGLPTLAEYYPGDDVVDLVGLSVFGLQAYDRGEFGHDRTFDEILKPGYDQAVRLGKPIWVAELGYSGSQAYVDNWAKTVELLYPQFPKLEAIVYFNDKEVYPWPKGYGLPDWRVNSNVTTSAATN